MEDEPRPLVHGGDGSRRDAPTDPMVDQCCPRSDPVLSACYNRICYHDTLSVGGRKRLLILISVTRSRFRYGPAPSPSPPITEENLRAAVAAAVAAVEAARPSVEDFAVLRARAERLEELLAEEKRRTEAAVDAERRRAEAAVAAVEAARPSVEDFAVLRARAGWLEELLAEERKRAEAAVAAERKMAEAAVAEERRMGELAQARAQERNDAMTRMVTNATARWSAFLAGAQVARRQRENRRSSA